jgi:hypothetical protein
MSSLIPESLALLGRAAELRARGTPWDDTATKLAVSVDDLRRLSCEHARAFARLSRRAEREFHDDAMNATVAKLLDLLNHEQVGIVLTAAATLIRYDLARMRHEENTSRPPKPTRPRDELPPPPSRSVTVENTGCDTACDTGCDSTPVAPQPQLPEQVPAEVSVADTTESDTVTAAPPSQQLPPTNAPAPVASISIDQVPAAPRENTRVVDAIRRRKWMPKGLPPSR